MLSIGAMGDRATQTIRFEDGKDQLLSGARIGGGFENDQLPALQIGLNELRRLLDEVQVRLGQSIERRGDADHHGVHLRQAREIIGRLEVLRTNVLLDPGASYVSDVALALIEL